jgi:enoyl-CoA hydratase/carnithine racemase
VRRAGDTDATGVVLAGNGPVFSSGHDLGAMVGADLPTMRHLLRVCADVMLAMQAIPQVVVARVHGLATAAGCQLVAAADLAVAARSARFGCAGRAGWMVLHHTHGGHRASCRPQAGVGAGAHR